MALCALLRQFACVLVEALCTDGANAPAQTLAAQIQIGLEMAQAVLEESAPEDVAKQQASLIAKAHAALCANRASLERRDDAALLTHLTAIVPPPVSMPQTLAELRALPPMRDEQSRAAVFEWVTKIARHTDRLVQSAGPFLA